MHSTSATPAQEKGRKGRYLAAGVAAIALLAPVSAATAAPGRASSPAGSTGVRPAAVAMHGTYTTPTASGTISYTPLRAFRGGSEGRYVIGGQTRPGSMYAAVGGGVGMGWFYGYTGVMAGTALVTLQPNGTYSGPITFLARDGSTLDAGTVTVTFP